MSQFPEETVRFHVELTATVEITKLEWEAYLGTNDEDENDALWELANAVDGNEFPIPDGRVWLTGIDKIEKILGG